MVNTGCKWVNNGYKWFARVCNWFEQCLPWFAIGLLVFVIGLWVFAISYPLLHHCYPLLPLLQLVNPGCKWITTGYKWFDKVLKLDIPLLPIVTPLLPIVTPLLPIVTPLLPIATHGYHCFNRLTHVCNWLSMFWNWFAHVCNFEIWFGQVYNWLSKFWNWLTPLLHHCLARAKLARRLQDSNHLELNHLRRWFVPIPVTLLQFPVVCKMQTSGRLVWNLYFAQVLHGFYKRRKWAVQGWQCAQDFIVNLSTLFPYSATLCQPWSQNCVRLDYVTKVVLMVGQCLRRRRALQGTNHGCNCVAIVAIWFDTILKFG